MPDRDRLGRTPAFLPYGRQEIGDADIKAVVEALCSGWLTTGPRVSEFEKAFAAHCGAAEGVAVNSGTAALHCAMRAIGIGPATKSSCRPSPLPPAPMPRSMKAACRSSPMSKPDTLLIDPVSVAHEDHAQDQSHRGGGLCRPARRL